MTPHAKRRLQKNFLQSIAADSHFHTLFEYIPSISFFAKDREGKIIGANHSFCERLEFTTVNDIIGLTDFELFPEGLAQNYRRDDLEVMRSGQAKLDLVELFLNRQGLADWFVTNKLPIFDRAGKIIGVMGTVQSYELKHRLSYPFPEIEKAVAYIRTHYREAIKMSELAQHVGSSVRHFDRRFKEALSISPKSFLIKTRIQSAGEILTKSGANIGEIAQELGFNDQSSFTLLFRREMGMTPLKYRKRYKIRSESTQ